jgi:uncharacterized membrane protein
MKEYLKDHDINLPHVQYEIFRLAISFFIVVLYIILLAITLVKVKCTLFFRMSLILFAYGICFAVRCIIDAIRLVSGILDGE